MPSVTADDLLVIFRTYLVGLQPAFVRRPDDDATRLTLPPLLLEPDGGPRAPIAPSDPGGDDVENHPLLVVSATFDVEVVVAPFDRYHRPIVVAVTYLSRATAGLRLARAVDDRIARAIMRDRPDAGYGWTMGVAPASIRILSSSIFGGLSKVADEEGGRARQVARYVFDVPTA